MFGAEGGGISAVTEQTGGRRLAVTARIYQSARRCLPPGPCDVIDDALTSLYAAAAAADIAGQNAATSVYPAGDPIIVCVWVIRYDTIRDR